MKREMSDGGLGGEEGDEVGWSCDVAGEEAEGKVRWVKA